MVKADCRKSSKIKVHLSSGLEMKQLNKVSRTARLAVSRTGSKCAYNQWNFNIFAMCGEDIEKNTETSLLCQRMLLCSSAS